MDGMNYHLRRDPAGLPGGAGRSMTAMAAVVLITFAALLVLDSYGIALPAAWAGCLF